MTKEQKDIRNKIKELKLFIIKQMKESNWIQHAGDHYSSEYLIIKLDENVSFEQGRTIVFFLKPGRRYSDNEVTIKDIGLSKIRFKWCLRKVKRSVRNSKVRDRAADVKRRWETFLDDNKDINRDTKIDKVLNS